MKLICLLLLLQLLYTAAKGPCNGHPEQRHLPVQHAFYLGTRVYKTDPFLMLDKGFRYLDIDLCEGPGSIYLCGDKDQTFKDIFHSLLTFTRESIEQVILVRFNAITTELDTGRLDPIIDELCETHASMTQGTDEYKKGECPFIYAHHGNSPWRSMGEIVNYDPEMSQWEGDGELVGVRSQLIVTYSNTMTDYNQSPHFTPVFWRSIEEENMKETMIAVHSACNKPLGGIGLTLRHFDKLSISDVEDVLMSKDGCHMDDTLSRVFFNYVSVDNTHDTPYLLELEDRMMEVNYAKWMGEYTSMPPSAFINERTRDEL
ncbi:hypothetical protein BDB01DRAFT_296418 [Pilobolus umbonatus]|nr:hypothetical protein BDB01DRAFT_296418 [Pilobolus umbonatus]